jgi:DNA topoisomerase II
MQGGKSKAGAKTGGALGPHNTSKSKKTIEETYQKLSQLEHILLRPDTYIGSTEKQPQCLWVHDGERMVLKSVNIAPGLYKIFDEILVNASDNKVRDPTMDTLRVDVDVEKGEISVLNNGAGIPVEVHKTEGIYVPELIFGNLLTSSNYNDNEKKVTGGRNGYGAKLANIFSTEFVVETCDGKRKRRYKQTFRSNMTQKGAPRITDCKPTDNWTCISFKPDLERFGMETLEEDTVALIRKRVYDIAGILGKTVKVYLNGQRLPIKDFQSYIDLYLGPRSEEGAVPRVYERFGDRWEVCVAATEGVFNQVSFVNSICTSKGGTHVNYLADQVVKYVCELLGKKHKQTNVKPFMVKSYLSIFVNCQIENPAFDSQTKDTLTLRASAFGSKCELPDPFLKKVAAAGVTDAVLNFANQKANKELKKGDGAKRQRLTGIPKLDDANDAGGVNSDKCTLILTEGDSAKSLAISGLSVVGRDRFGVFPLRGKLLNVREASTTQITGNAEIQNIKQILGLQHGKQYKDTKSLRYGHLMIMTDQDHDGSHIKGLIMNYFHTFYPSLLRLPGFLVEFITPIIKVTKGRQSISFFTLPEYETWCKTVNTRGWMIKYYKGLGTSTSAEAKEYFANIQSHRKEFVWEGTLSI